MLRKIVKNNPKLLSMVKLIKLLLRSKVFEINGHRKKKPKVLQLPITYNCNSKCVMCNVWKMDHSNEATIEEFRAFMQDPLFSEVTDLGINGGEVTLIEDLEPYVNEILKLPSLKRLNIISNAFRGDVFLEQVKMIRSKCLESKVEFHISISLDGLRDVHDEVRGVRGAFEKTIKVINEIKDHTDEYCNSYNVGCTVSQYNVNNLIELDTYCKINGINIKYRFGIENKRIDNSEILEKFSVTYSDAMFSAKEFFHYKYFDESDWYEKFKYFSIFYWLKNQDNKKRLLGCIWKDEGATLDSRGELYYCAVKSKSLGSLRESKGSDIFFEPDNIKYRMDIVKNNCDDCIHDYSGDITLKAFFTFIIFILRGRFSMSVFKVMGKLGI